MENNNNNNAEVKAIKPIRRRAPKPKGEANLVVADNTQKPAGRRKFFNRRRGNNRVMQSAYPQSGPNKRYQRFHKPSMGEKLVNTLSGLISKSLKTIIPWVIVSTLVFTYGAYAIFNTATLNLNLPTWYIILLAIAVFGFFGLFGLFYGIGMALLYTVKSFSESIGAIVKEAINRIKNSIESKLESLSDSVSKKEVATIIKSAFEDISQNMRRYASNTAVGLIALSAMGAVLFFTKNTLIRSVSAIKNKGEFFAVLSAKTALFAAIILNLSFFAKLAIWAGYLIGLLVILAQVIAIFLIK